MKKILLTGFEPFGGEQVNPALEAVRSLEGEMIGGAKVTVCTLPVVQKKALHCLFEKMEELKPDLIVAIGQAGGRPELSLERVAINIDDYRIKDNEGNQPIDEAIVAGAPVAYWSSLPIKAMLAAVRQAGIPASVSNSAGTFVCNHLFYGLMHRLQENASIARGGFIHIPYLPEQAARNPGQPSMALETIVSGLKIMLEAAVKNETDIKIAAGAVC